MCAEVKMFSETQVELFLLQIVTEAVSLVSVILRTLGPLIRSIYKLNVYM